MMMMKMMMMMIVMSMIVGLVPSPINPKIFAHHTAYMNSDLNAEYNNINDDDVYVCRHTPSPINHEIPVHHTVGEVQ